jgi:hypothetical protein
MSARVVLLRHRGPADRWRVATFWQTSDESAVASAERDFDRQAATLAVGGIALVAGGMVRRLRMAGA